MTKERIDLKKVKESLDSSHYGLNNVKERIIEYLIVKERSVSNKSPIIISSSSFEISFGSNNLSNVYIGGIVDSGVDHWSFERSGPAQLSKKY